MKILNKLNKTELGNNKKEILLSFLSIILIFFIDRFSKIKIITLNSEDRGIYINEFINFDLVWNTGIAFGFLSSNSNLTYNIISIVIGLIILFLIYLMIISKIFEKFLFSLILGGALGNFYDRVVYKAVPDFIDLHFERFHWFTFNIADIFITIGILLFITKDIFLKNEKN